MDNHGNIYLPLSSDDPSLNLLNEFIESFGDDLPNSAYVDIFGDDELKFELYTKTSKYLGEDLYYLSSEDTGPKTTIINEIDSGDNLFNPFKTIPDGTGTSFPLSGSSLSATAGSDLVDSDIIWQFVDNKLEGAWYKKFDEEFIEDHTCLKISTGSFDMRFPFGDRGLSGEDIGWSGPSLRNCSSSVYTDQDSEKLKNEIEIVYWSSDTSLSSAEPIALNITTLIDDGASPSKNIFRADQVQIKPNRDSTEEEFAWLFDFDHTELPISCGLNQIYWPLFRYDSTTREFPFKIRPDQCEDIPLVDLPLNQIMCGSVAGLTPETSDKIYKKSGFCESGIEGAWLRGCDVSTIGYDIFLPANQEDICNGATFYIDDNDNLAVSSSCINPFTLEGSGLISGQLISSLPITNSITYKNLISNTSKLSIQGTTLEIGEYDINALGVPFETGRVSSLIYEPNKDISISNFGDYFNIGQFTFNSNHKINQISSDANSVDIDLEIYINGKREIISFKIEHSINFDGTAVGVLKFINDNPQKTIDIDGDEYTLSIKFSGETLGEDLIEVGEGFSGSTNMLLKITAGNISNSNNTIISSVVKLLELDLLSGYSYELEVSDCGVTISGESEQSGELDVKTYQIDSDGLDFIYVIDEKGNRTQSIATNLLYCFRRKVKSLENSSRQTGLSFLAPAGEETHFFWEFPDSDATEVLNGYDHDEYCDYLKLDSYTSIINSSIGDPVNEWNKCNCKAVYYSPIGNSKMGISGFDDYKNFSDVIYLDSGVEPFSYTTWVDEDGNDYRVSDQFGVFKYSGIEPDSGYGIGYWETLSGKPLILKKGKSYVYRRASFGGCSDNKPPCFVARNCHCYDSCSDSVCKPTWIKLVQDSNGEWLDTGEISDMVLEAGQFYEYDKIGSVKYNIYKNGEKVERTTPKPSFSMNIPLVNAKPYWATSPTDGALNVGLSAFETTEYLLTTQPNPSEMIIENGVYFNYVRNSCDPFIWEQPLKFTVDYQLPNQWKKLDFGFTSPTLLQKIVGCGECELSFIDSPDSCFLKSKKCNTYIGKVTPTNENSDMILKTPSDCGASTEIYYFAQSPITWEQEVSLVENSLNPTAPLYSEAVQPWANYENGPDVIIRTEEGVEHLRSVEELGVFIPRNVGVNKLQCFGKTNNLI